MKRMDLNDVIALIGGFLLVLGVVTADSPSLRFPIACVALGGLFLYVLGYIFNDDDDDDDFKY